VSTRMAIGLTCALMILLLGGCKKKQAQPAATGSHETPILCARCEAANTLYLASEARLESWPKVCPSCGRWAAYAAGQCKECGKSVLLRDSRVDSFGYPEICPHCRKPWHRERSNDSTRRDR